MSDVPDTELLEQFGRNQSEAAFAELVRRHLGLVYSTAFRKTEDAQQAEDITQVVFIILARKAGSLSSRTVLPGWLYHTTRLTAANLQRAEIRRIHREQEVFMQSTTNESAPDALWRELSPLLEDAMAGLGASDRDAIVLRFFQNRSLADVGAALGIAERAAQKRVDRALEKLRKFFTKRGVASTTAIIAGAISGNSVQTAPAGLAKTISAVALAKGATASASTLTLVKGALKIMAWTKTQTAVVVGAGILLAAGATTLAVKEVQNYKNDNYPWQVENPTPDMLNTIPPLVKIVPTKFPNRRGSTEVSVSSSSLGIGVHIQDILRVAYNDDALYDPNKTLRMLLLTKIPSAKYDYIANFRLHNPEEFRQDEERLSSGNVAALQKALKKQFGLVGRRETIVTNVLLLEVKYPNAPGLEPVTAQNQAPPNQEPGEISFQDDGCRVLAGALANEFMMPVLDGTGLTNRYYYDLKWTPSRARRQNQRNLKQALLNQLGLELVPTNMPIEMLVVEKTDPEKP